MTTQKAMHFNARVHKLKVLYHAGATEDSSMN